MPVDKESKAAAWIAALREWAPTVPKRVGEWWEAVREDPGLVWRTDAVRYSVYTIGAIIAICILSAVAESMTPPLPEGAGEYAETAFFDCLCTECGHHFVIERKFKFDDFPVVCPKCKKESGQRAERASSGPDKGKWVVQSGEQ
jgi:hypothetical protein